MDATWQRTTSERPPRTIVWIDAHEAVIVRWDGAAKFIRIPSAVPAHRRSTGRVAHDPMTRHGGGGSPQEAGERHRQEHLHQFIAQVEARLRNGDDIEIVGPGTVRERLARLVATNDQRRGRRRLVETRAAGPLTESKLVALVREAAGDPPARGREGAPGFN